MVVGMRGLCGGADRRPMWLLVPRTNLGDLCKFDTDKEEWSIMPLRGQMPPPGYGQSLCR